MLYFHSHPHLAGLAHQLFAHHFEPGGAAWKPGALVFVTPVQGIETWLRREISRTFGVSMSHSFASQRQVLAPVIGLGTDPVSRERLAGPDILQWHVAAALQRLHERGDLAQWPEMQGFLAGHTDTKCDLWLGLGRQLAVLYDRYSRYMPRELLRWQSDPHATHWQARLWRELWLDRATIQDPILLPGLVWAAGQTIRQPADSATLILFGYSRLEPLDMRLLAENYPAAELYLIAPSAESVSDSVGQQAENPILGNWGRVARNNEAMVLELEELELAVRSEARPEPDGAAYGALQVLQQSVRRMEPIVQAASADASLVIHRDLHPASLAQRVRQQLLSWFDDPQLRLQPQDVVILCSDMERYGPALHGALGGLGVVAPVANWAALDELALPHSLSDMPAAETGWDVRLLRWLALATGQVARSEVLELLHDDLMQRMYGLDAEAVDWLDYATARAGVRGGLSAAHRAHRVDVGREFVSAIGTWHAFLERFQAARLLGLEAMQQAELWQVADSAEIGVHDQALEAIAQLLDDILQLQVVVGQLDAGAWCHLIASLSQARLASLNPTEDQAQSLARWYEALRTLQRRAAPAPLPLSLSTVHAELEQLLSLAASERGFLRRGITVAGFRPSRIIPARAYVLVGFAASDFPRGAVRSSMDLLLEGKGPAGDWLKYAQTDYGDDDLAMLLNSLMSATERLALVLEVPNPESGETLGSGPADLLRKVSGCPVYGSTGTSLALVPSLREQRLVHLQQKPHENQWSPPKPLVSVAVRQWLDLAQLSRFWRYPALWFLRRFGSPIPHAGEADDDAIVWDPDPLQRGALRRSALAWVQCHQGTELERWRRYAERTALLDGSVMRAFEAQSTIRDWLALGEDWLNANLYASAVDIRLRVAQDQADEMFVRIGGECSLPWRCDAQGMWHALSASSTVSRHLAALELAALSIQLRQPLQARLHTPEGKVTDLQVASVEDAQTMLAEVVVRFRSAHSIMPAVFPDLAQFVGLSETNPSVLVAKAQDRWNPEARMPSPDIRDVRMRVLVETYGAGRMVAALGEEEVLAQGQAYLDWLRRVRHD